MPKRSARGRGRGGMGRPQRHVSFKSKPTATSTPTFKVNQPQGETESSVIVSCLSKKTTEKTLELVFSFKDEVISVKIIKVKNGPFNHAYVKYKHSEHAERAVSLCHGMKIDGSIVEVKICDVSPTTNAAVCQVHSDLSHPHMVCPCPPSKVMPLVPSSHSDQACNPSLPVSAILVGQSSHKSSKSSSLKNSHKSVKRVKNSVKIKAIPLYECKQLSCHSSVSTMITSESGRYAEELKTLTDSHKVVVKLLQSGLGLCLFGIKEDVAAAEKDIMLLVDKVQCALSKVKEPFALSCHYVPLFAAKDGKMRELLQQIKSKHDVEFLIVNNDHKLEEDIDTFIEFAAKQLSSKSETVTPDISCLSMYFSSSASSSPTEQLWLWEDDHGGYTPYDHQRCTILEQQFKENPKRSVFHSISSKLGVATYKLDFRNMTQTNVSTGNSRRIQRKVGAPVWLYANDYRKMVPYSSQHSDQIEAMKNTGSSSVLTINGRRYSFDFTRMKQINVDTKHERSIQRSVAAQTNTCPKLQLSLVVHGLPECLEIAIAQLKSYLQAAVVQKVIRLPQEIDESFHTKLLFTIHHYFVSANIVDNSIRVKGIQGYVEEIMLIIRDQIFVYEKEILFQKAALLASSLKGQIPDRWESQTEQVALKVVKRSSLEWTEITNRIRKTLPQAQIEKIERIQNKWQWEKYSFSKKRMFTKNSGEVNEKELFHGTRGTPPEKIYKSEQGFDFRFASSGMWGTGTYFAVNANYSDRYAYTSSQSSKQIILAKVLTGETYACAPDCSLKKPPVKPQHASSSRATSGLMSILSRFIFGQGTSDECSKADTFEDELYDSVSGHTSGSDVVVIYDHEKAYPAYLITYSCR